MIAPVAQALPWDPLFDALTRIVGFGVLAAGTAAIAALVFRWYGGDELPDGVGILVGVTTVAIWLNTKTALQDAIIGTSPLLETETAVYTVVAFVASAIAADAGRRLGDGLARETFAAASPRTIDDVSQLVRSAGRVIAVELPDSIEDVDGYDPVEAATKEALAGETFRFPRRLTVEQLRERVIARLERDYGIGHVDVELDADGTVDYLAVGSRRAGIGPTLAPGTVAVAIRADPAPDASPGDAVRVWETDGDSPRRIADGELRGTAGDVATVAVDADDASALETDGATRLVTLPRNPGAERDLVSLLRAADETVTTLSVEPGSALADARIDSLPVLVVAVDRDGEPIALPSGDRRLAGGDVAYVLGRPEALRRIPS